MADSFATRARLDVNGTSYAYCSLARLGERFDLAPSDFLFVDDSARNIEAARSLGFDVHHFTDPAALMPALEQRGLA